MNKYLNKLIMYHEIHRLNREGCSICYIADYLVLNWRTVKKYLSMDESQYEAFIELQTSRKKELESYEHFVKVKLDTFPETSASQMHDWLKEHYQDFPSVNPKTVYNFVMLIRQKYNIPKQQHKRDYFIVEELPYGKQAQVDFGQYNMRTSTGKRKKVYFFTMVLSRSRYKYVHFLDKPFTTQAAVQAHEQAFKFYGGIPEEVVYDQDRLFIVDENRSDFILTEAFKSYVREKSFNLYFCKKADPETKGKIENVVRYVKQNFLYNRSFCDIDTLNEESIAWLNRTANFLSHGKTKQPPFEQWHIERNHLNTFVPMKTAMDSSKLYTVRKDNSISYKSNMYTVPEGTWSAPESLVSVTAEDGMLIIKSQDGQELSRHIISAKKGQTIRNTDHKRDKTLKITAMMENEARNFSNPERAMKYFQELRSRKRRHIRDQVTIIRQSFQQYGKDVLEKTLDYCIENSVYSAVDFTSVAKKIYQESENSQNGDDKPDIKTLPNRNKLTQIQPTTSEILDYESLMPN
jgi:hypothetical protein